MTNNDDAAVRATGHLRSSDVSESLFIYVRHSWQRRHFAFAMPADKFRSRNQNTVLGNLWNLLNPLLTAGVYFLIFGVILNASRGIDNYIFWLVIGLFVFRLTQSTVMQGAVSITSRQGLVRSLRFPRVLLPVASTIGELLTFAFEVLILFVFAFATGEGISWRIIILPVALLLHTTFNFGCALIAARCNDSFRDVEKFLPFVFQILRYLSGVMVPLALFGDRGPRIIHTLLLWNPLVWILDIYRWIFLGDAFGMQVSDVLIAIATTFIVLLVGLKFFASAEHRYGRP
jgi:teichoic acid transport system permease protein